MTRMPRSVDWLRRLVAHDTTSRGPNQPLIDEVADYLNELGVSHQVRPHPDQAGKANLVATIPAADGSTAGGVLLSGHTDVVPVDGQDWSTDPFTATLVDDRIYGRGTADMKGFIAVVLEAVPAMLAEPLNRPVHLALSYDEELGCLGAGDLVDCFTEGGITPDIGIVGEPTTMRVIRAHKASYVAEAVFTGVAAHSSLTNQGVNAIEYAAELVRWCRERADRWRTEGPFDEAFPIAYTTMSVNTIDGGIAQNTVPDRCALRFEYRAIGAVDPDAVLVEAEEFVAGLDQRMRAEDERAGARLEVLARVPGLDTGDGAVCELCTELGLEILPDKVTYGTEAGMFAEAGVDTVVCGPGDIAVAHAADEYVTLDQLRACEEFIDNLIGHLRR
ncbi:acetylornithine deacetylase [Enemella sp. A6]|uniref:acetylornithine deacetylase n=1 Tax=Enemella sp. A6 TaxID=3440152 RepID=UPI003EB883FE